MRWVGLTRNPFRMVACLVGNKVPITLMNCQIVCVYNEMSNCWDRLTNFTYRGLESESGGEYATTLGGGTREGEGE